MQLLPRGKQRSRTTYIHIAIAPPLAGRSPPTQPSEASGASIRCLKRLQPVSWCKVQQHGPGRTTGLLPLCSHPPLHQPPPKKWWGLQWQGKLSPDSPSMAISPDGRKYTVHFWPLSGPNVNITVKSSNSDTRHGAIYSSRIKLATEFIPKYRVYFPGSCP